MKSGAVLIAEERKRQIESEGYTAEHDSTHNPEDLAAAGACYALEDVEPIHEQLWPWDAEWWKPKDQLRNLVRAGALIAAAIDRYQMRHS